jgi:hypothetical protein
MVFDGGSDGKARSQQATTTTARIELKWQTADGVIGGCRYCRRRPLSSLIDNVFQGGGAPSSFDRGRRRRGLVVSLPLLSPRGGAPPDPDGDGDDNNEDQGNDDEDDEDYDDDDDDEDDDDQCR